MSDEALSILIHGPAGGGKSTFAATGPKPILLLDAERAARFIRLRKVKWDPMREAPPVYDGTWDMAVVKTNNWDTALKAYEYLKSGKHPFRTVVIDSISEIQVKAMENINGRSQMQTHHWGRLLQNMGAYLRDLRDLLEDDETDSPLQVLVLISTSKNYEGTWKPFLQGGIASQVPYMFDIVGYYYANQIQDPTTGEVKEVRELFTGNHPQYEAKCRPAGVPASLQNTTLEAIFNNIFGVQTPAPAQAPAPAAEVPAPPAPPANANSLALPVD
jgi:hypothetical protein